MAKWLVVGFSQHMVRLGVAALVWGLGVSIASASPQGVEPPVLDLSQVDQALTGPNRWSPTREGVLLASLDADPREWLDEYGEEFDFYYEFPRPVPLAEGEFDEELNSGEDQDEYAPAADDQRHQRYQGPTKSEETSLLGDLTVAPNPGNISLLMVVFAVLVVLWNAKHEQGRS